MKAPHLLLVLSCFMLVSWTATEAQAQSLTGKTHKRDTWYIGFGIGSGVGGYEVNGQEFDLDQVGQPVLDPSIFTFNFKAGATLSENLLVGADISGIRSQADGVERITGTPVSLGVELISLNVTATWFPQREGFFLRGGVGASTISANIDVGNNRYKDSSDGLGILLGTGFAFWLGDAFNLSINADAHFHNYSGDTLQPNSGDFLNIYLGCDWF